MSNCCTNNDSDVKRNVLLIFAGEALLYDISNYGYIEGSVSEDEINRHIRHTIQDLTQSGNIDRVGRVLDLAHAKCVEYLYPFAKRQIEDECIDDIPIGQRKYKILLKLPTRFSETTVKLLEKLIHEYMVSSVLADWLSITNTPKAIVWKAKADELETEIRSCTHMRTSRTRIRSHPF